ncbi:MAG: HPr family phosphocarrier protein [Chloroflexi bacterium]|nr:MAG: HPr family phosphocarrier protein [Chloroflexota bacterium]
MTLVVTHPDGLHARPASLFVKTAQKFKSNTRVSYNGVEANAKSILSILTLGAVKGAEVTISSEGDDSEEALQALRSLIDSNFGE